MTEITQADREAAAVFYGTWGGTKGWQHLEEPIRKGLVDDNALVQAFARHRMEALSAEIERLREALRNIGNLSLNGCIKVNTPHGLWVGTPDAYAREALGMPWRTEDPDYSNEMLRG